MGAPDWRLVETYPNRYKTMAPKRDVVATDGMRITLGGTTVTLWNTPGHTPGTLSYIKSQQHIAAQAAASGATVILSNHSELDNAVNKNRMIAGRGDGPHPYDIGADGVQRYFQVMHYCARAAQLRLEQQRTEAARRGSPEAWALSLLRSAARHEPR